MFGRNIDRILQAAASGLQPKAAYVLALSDDPKGAGKLQALSGFTTNPAGAAIVNTVGPLREVVGLGGPVQRRYLVIAEGMPDTPGKIVQLQH